MQQVADWLEKLGLGQYAQRFAQNGISFSVLAPQQLTEPFPVIGQMERAAGLAHGDTAQSKLNKRDALLGRTAASADAALYVAAVLARRLEGANQVFVQLKSQLEADQPRSVVAKTVEQLEGLLNVSDGSLVYADRDW